jgi:predicted small metal-binding protein
MSIGIPCNDLGGDCVEAIQSSSLEGLVIAAAIHAANVHGLPMDRVSDAMVATELRAAVPQASRPLLFRSAMPRALSDN